MFEKQREKKNERKINKLVLFKETIPEIYRKTSPMLAQF